MTTLVAGASGATGKLVVQQLLSRKTKVKAIVRSAESLGDDLRQNDQLTVIQASILDLTPAELAQHVQGCSAVVSCLGHNLTFQGIFGHPRQLVVEATRRLCQAIEANVPQDRVRFVLMSTNGYQDQNLNEPLSIADSIVIGILRRLLPPQRDNEAAADFLKDDRGPKHDFIEWVAVRPDNLINEESVTGYDVHPSPIRGVIFDSGKTSRINVGHFMASLILQDDLWSQWIGQMPVIYNRGA